MWTLLWQLGDILTWSSLKRFWCSLRSWVQQLLIKSLPFLSLIVIINWCLSSERYVRKYIPVRHIPSSYHVCQFVQVGVGAWRGNIDQVHRYINVISIANIYIHSKYLKWYHNLIIFTANIFAIPGSLGSYVQMTTQNPFIST